MKVGPDNVEEGAERSMSALRCAGAREHQRPMLRCMRAKLVHETRFADAGRAGDIDRLDAGTGCGEASLQRLELTVTADEGREPSAQRGGETRRVAMDRIEAIDLFRRRTAFELALANKRRLDQTFDWPIGRLAQNDRPGFSQGLQPRGDVHCIPQKRQSPFAACFQMAENGRPGVDSNSQFRLNVIFRLDFCRGGLEAGEDGERRATGPERCVLERGRRAERNHDSVADDLVNTRALGLHGAFDHLRQFLHQLEGGLLAEPFRNGGEANHVREENDDLPALWFQARPRFIKLREVFPSGVYDIGTTFTMAGWLAPLGVRQALANGPRET